jgi:four helix bundle protein
MATHNFREMMIWKKSIVLVKKTYVLSNKLPKDENFNLICQINRSAVSIPSNIAEGSGKTTNKDFKRFLDHSIASSYELETQLILVSEIYNFDSSQLVKELNTLQNRIVGFKKQLKD